MKPKVIKIILGLVIIATLIGAGVGIYFYYNQGPVVGRIQFGKQYHLTSIRTTERFAGATMSKNSYFKIDTDGKTGSLYLENLTATAEPIKFVVTNYQESPKQTTIEFEYLLDDGEKTKIQTLTAVSTNDRICIYDMVSYNVGIIQEKPSDITKIEYSSLILEFKLNGGEA